MLSTIGVLLSTLLVGGGFLLLTRAVGFELPAIWCFVFGALISPTDPVSVMGVLNAPTSRPRSSRPRRGRACSTMASGW